jgi:GNAT superfamily N-acetyltransferase
VDGFDSSPVFMMTYNPRYYMGLMTAAGFQKAKDLVAFYMDLSNSPLERLGRIAAKTRERHKDLAARPVLRKTLRQDLAKVKEVYNEAWSQNWGFVPMTDREIEFMADRLKPLFYEGLVRLVESPSGPVAFLLALPDYNEAIKPLRGRLATPRVLGFIPHLLGWRCPKRVRVITLGVKEVYRNHGLESVLLHEGLAVGAKAGFVDCEASWVLEDNVKMRKVIELFGARVYKTYRVYERDI